MKSFICTFAIAAIALIGAAPDAEARSYDQSSPARFSGYSHSGKPVYTKSYIVGYDRYGRPIWASRSAPAPSRYCAPPPRCHPAPVYRPRYGCDSGPRHHGGITVYGSFRR